MYNKWFFIKRPVWNNEFSFDKRVNKKLYVPSVINIENTDEIELQDDIEKIAFEDFKDSKISTNYGLKNFYKIKWYGKEIVLFDNHNHAFYFWYEARSKGIIWDNNILIHIDEHSDMKNNNKYLQKPNSFDLQKVFKFTNYSLNVWDYIASSVKEGIIWKVIQVRSEESLKNIFPFINWEEEQSKNIILNLDLDFFEPKLDYINYDLKKKVILDIARKAKVITIATSPFFINQELALKIFKDIFW